jgi:hypothetical protein
MKQINGDKSGTEVSDKKLRISTAFALASCQPDE